MDFALQTLLQALATAAGSALWVADEHTDDAAAVAAARRGAVTALTNRCDVAALLQARGVAAVLADFDFTAVPNGAPAVVALRVAKEKALVHHVLNRALEQLAPGGQLWLAGAKH